MDSSGFGYRPPRFHLLDQELHLDPDIQRMGRELETRMAARQMVGLWLQPDFSLPAWQNVVYQPVQTVQTVQTPVGPMFSPDDDRYAPKPAVLSDVTDAIYKLPVVQGVVGQIHDEGLRRLRLWLAEWNHASTGERTVEVSAVALVVGSSIGIILANQPTRQIAFDFIKGKDLPVPWVDPLHFQILDRGGAISADLGHGLSGSARLQFPGAPSHPDYNVMITLDVVKLARGR